MQAINQETTIRVGHFYLDVSRRLLHLLNPEARELHNEGVPLASLDPLCQPLLTLEGEAVTAANLPLQRACREGTPVEAQYLLPRPGGSPWLISWTALPLRGAGGQIVGVLGSVTCRPPEPKWQLLAELAHDLGTPLHALGLLSTLLSQLPAGEELQKTVAAIRMTTDRALQISRQLLDCCRGPAPRTRSAEPHWFALEPFLLALAHEQVPAAERKGLSLRMDFTAVRGWEILVDRIRLGRLLANLLVNAVRYTSRGQVDFTATWLEKEGSRQLALGIADTGAGISEDEKASIFYPFERGRSGRDSDSLGSGLGLSVVDRLVAELGLTLDLSSELGQGTAFHLLMPQALLRQEPGTTEGPG